MGSNEEYQKIVDVVARYSVHYPLIKFTCKKVEDKKTDVTTHAVPRPKCLIDPDSEDEQMGQEKLMDSMNSVRADIIRRHYGQMIVGKDSFGTFKYWDILQMGVNLYLTKPNTV